MVFSLDADSDFFENIAKFRVARKMWAGIAKEKLGAQTERAMKLKIGIRTSGLSLQEQNPLNNAARVAFQILSCVMGGVNSIDASSIDEALGLPSFEARMYSLNTQHIIAHETNVPLVGDPMGGSYYLEWLTKTLETRTAEYMAEIERRGGIYECLDSGWFQAQMNENRSKVIRERGEGRRLVIGVDAFKYENGPINEAIGKTAYTPPSVEVREQTVAEVKAYKEGRDQQALKPALKKVYLAAKSGENIVRPVIDAVKAGMTLGEMVGVIRLGYGLSYDNLDQIDTPRVVREMLEE
jgi:methylmalonyl-CoA mutase N-terminal domain/subunit